MCVSLGRDCCQQGCPHQSEKLLWTLYIQQYWLVLQVQPGPTFREEIASSKCHERTWIDLQQMVLRAILLLRLLSCWIAQICSFVERRTHYSIYMVLFSLSCCLAACNLFLFPLVYKYTTCLLHACMKLEMFLCYTWRLVLFTNKLKFSPCPTRT